jgi:UDP-N-acetylmuramyl pentapeptide synthase
MTAAIATLADAEAARDRVIAVLRHELCYEAHRGRNARLARDRNAGLSRAFATGQALQTVLRELGDPGDRSLPKPDGVLPLDPAAENAARDFLGSAADALLGKRRVL